MQVLREATSSGSGSRTRQGVPHTSDSAARIEGRGHYGHQAGSGRGVLCPLGSGGGGGGGVPVAIG